MTNHILLYTDDFGIGGVAQYNHSILLGLVQRGYRVTSVQGNTSNPLIAEQQALGIDHEWLPFNTIHQFDRTLTNVDEAARIFLQAQPDLILFSDGCPVSNFAAKQAARRLGIAYLVVVGFVDPDLATRFEVCLPDLAHQYSQAKAVVAVSQENLELLHQFFHLPPDQGQVIYYGRPDSYFAPPDLDKRDRLRQEVGIPTDAIVCFTAARLEGIKGYQYQLDAIAQLRHTTACETLYFIWAGDGALRQTIEQAIQELDVGDRVKLLGQRWDIADWFDAADMFVLPTHLEGMPLAVMEAMAKGLPVIASAVSGIPEELGDTGKLLSDPKQSPSATLSELTNTLQAWVKQPALRHAIGQAGKRRAEELFREERMVQQTLQVIERSLLPEGDYVSPGFSIVLPDRAFPNMGVGDPQGCPWVYLRRDIPHTWYVDQRQPIIGFLSRDEAHILYNTALQFKGKRALEIGCWVGWSTCHLALAGVALDVVDPLLEQPAIYQTVSDSLSAAGVRSSVNLVAGYSPAQVQELAAQHQRKWSLIFIDGNHDTPGPLQDAIACEQLAEPDALILFHDLTAPDVAEGLDYLQQHGWNTQIYHTMQIMGVAWRGNVQPVAHQPDPRVAWQLPNHLRHHPVSGRSPASLSNHSRAQVANPVLSDPMQQLLMAIEQLQVAPVELVDLDRNSNQQWINQLQQGKTAYIQGDREAATGALKQVLQEHPRSIVAHQYLSTLYWQQGDIQQSLRHHALAQSGYTPEAAKGNHEFQSLLTAVRPYTLLSDERLFCLYSLAKQICLDDIPGHFVECGTYRGGSAALLAAVIQRYSMRPRMLYAFDTFAGMPEPTDADRHNGIPANLTGFGVGTLKAPMTEYLNVICQSLGVTERVTAVPGLFAQTLPAMKAEIGKIALLHADGDWYESTMDIFTTLYASVEPDGFIQIDDYGHWEGCRRAVHEFERSQNAAFALRSIDYTGVWFRKQDAATPDCNHWRSLWQWGQTATKLGNIALAERVARAVLKLVPGLVSAEELLMSLGGDPNEFERTMHQPDALDDLEASTQGDWDLAIHQRLRQLNLIAFPDWTQLDDRGFPVLVDLLRAAIAHPCHAQMTLLLVVGDNDEAEADLAISAVIMQLLTEEGMDLTDDGPDIALVNPLSDSQWRMVSPHITGWIDLGVNDQKAIAAVAATLPRRTLAELTSLSTSTQPETSAAS
jgi:glycosyltransferase involved in cell wall biosynthesis/predicted O-methyltransferase YrrM